MDEIKSAKEIAREKIEQVGEVSEEDKLRWKYRPEGEKLAAKYLKDGHDLAAEMAGYPANSLPYIKKGLEGVLSAAIVLPKLEGMQARNKRAIDGLVALKKDRGAAGKLAGQMRQVLEHYTDQGEKQRKATREALKEQYEAKVHQAMDKQLGASAGLESMKINVETLPQFQEEWRRVSAQMDQQYLGLLDQFKKEMAKIT
jgi:hypothetical protein